MCLDLIRLDPLSSCMRLRHSLATSQKTLCKHELWPHADSEIQLAVIKVEISRIEAKIAQHSMSKDCG